jgi:hypothetical protein
MKSSIYLRAHTEYKSTEKKAVTKKRKRTVHEKWPEFALVFDTETRTDVNQSLTFGFYRLLRNANGAYSDVREEGIFFPESCSPQELDELKKSAAKHASECAEDCPTTIQVRPLADFIRTVFMPNALAGALVVGFNLPFDLTRIALDARDARRLNEDWSLVMDKDVHPRTGEVRENPFLPRVKITRKDGKFAFIRFSGVSIQNPQSGKRFKPYVPGRFLDLRTLGWALRNVTFSLASACATFGVPGKLDHEPTGLVSAREIAYCRQDVRATAGLLNALRAEFDCHPIDLKPNSAYSPASIAKAYLRAMGVVPPSRKFDFAPQIQGIATQAYFGGRAEARIRRTVVPTVCTDFKSEYPTVNTLMGLWTYITAANVRIQTATVDVRNLLTNLKLDTVFHPEFWHEIRGYALVEPDGDILPVRTTYNGESNNVGLNPLTSEKPLWFAIPDLVASTLLTGKPPKILKAFRIVAEGRQSELRSVALRGRTVIDPEKHDFFKTVIEARERVAHDMSLPEAERAALAYFLKILANAGSYGLFIETTPKRVPERLRVEVMSGESAFSTTSEVVEDKGTWYCPVISSLITAGGRLLLSILERSVCDEGGSYVCCDTDSMMFVSKKKGGLAVCEGGRDRLRDGTPAIKALPWDCVKKIVARFEKLNPYNFGGSILKVEKQSLERQLWGYAVSTKRYCLFTRTKNEIQIQTASSHGLGYLFLPNYKFDAKANAPTWVVQAWEYMVRQALNLPECRFSWFQLPAMMRIGITTPRVLHALQIRQEDLPYENRQKPFNFVLSPQIAKLGLSGFPEGVDADRFTLFAPFTKNPSTWFASEWINLHDGKTFRLVPISEKTEFDAAPQLLEDVIVMYQVHPESKSLSPDGTSCNWHTTGLLQRTPVIAVGQPQFIGKETDRRWEQEDDISVLFPMLPVYSPNETEKLVTDCEIQSKICEISVRTLARNAQLSPTTIQAIKSGRRIRKSTSRKLRLFLELQEQAG